jgi:hypothetical protein
MGSKGAPILLVDGTTGAGFDYAKSVLANKMSTIAFLGGTGAVPTTTSGAITSMWSGKATKTADYEGKDTSTLTAKQTGAKEITLTLSKEEAGATYTVTKGTVAQSVASTKVDGTTVVLTMDSAIKKADYTVTSSTGAKGPFTGEEAALKEIKIASELIPTITPHMYSVKVDTLDQFGGAFKVSSMDSKVTSATNSDGTPGTVSEVTNGVVTITLNRDLTLASTVTLSLVKGTVVGTQTLTVSASSVAKEINVGELTMTDAEKKINTTGRIDSDDLAAGGDDYYFPITAKDQYGNALTATQLGNMVTAGTLIISPKNADTAGFKPANAGASTFSTLSDGSVVMYIVGNGTAYGSEQITLVSTSGTTATAKATVAQDELIKTLTVTPSDTLTQGAEVAATVEATNNYDETVDLYKDVTYESGANFVLTYKGGDAHSANDGTAHVTFTNATMTATKNAATKKVSFTITAGAAAVTAITYANNGTNVTSASYTAQATGVPTTIKGLASTVDTTIAKGATINLTTAGNVLFLDQYDKVIKSGTASTTVPGYVDEIPAADNNYYFMVGESSNASVATNTAGTITAVAAGTATFDITLHQNKTGVTNPIDTWTLKITVIDKDATSGQYASYDCSLKAGDELLYTGALSSTSGDSATIVVKGTDANGNTAKLSAAGGSPDYTVVARTMPQGSTPADMFTITADKITVTDAKTLGTTASTGTLYADIYVGSSKVGTVEVPYSNATPEAAKMNVVDANDNAVDISSGITVGASGAYYAVLDHQGTDAVCINANTGASLSAYDYKVTFSDQYGMSNMYAKFGTSPLVTKSSTTLTTKGTMTLYNGSFSQQIEIAK